MTLALASLTLKLRSANSAKMLVSKLITVASPVALSGVSRGKPVPMSVPPKAIKLPSLGSSLPFLFVSKVLKGISKPNAPLPSVVPLGSFGSAIPFLLASKKTFAPAI